MTEHTSPLDNERLQELETTFIRTGENDSRALDYFLKGGCLRQCLSEIRSIAGETELEQQADAAREAYMAAVLTRPTLRNRLNRKQALRETEAAYVDSVLAKIDAVVDAKTIEDTLAVRQMPSLVSKTSFEDDEPIPLRDLAANHLYVLMDTALQEHSSRRKAIYEHQQASVRARVAGNRSLRVAVAGGLLVAAYVPELGVVPTPDEYITTDIEGGLKVVSAVIFGLDAPELIRLKYLQVKHDRRSRELQNDLADNKELTDLALRTLYSGPRYGSSQGPLQVTDRYGTNDHAENLRRFDKLESEFERLHGDPGGKPYTPAQALGYAARFLIERRPQLDEICQPHQKRDEQKQAYIQLCREILHEDLDRMKKGLTITRYRKEFMKMFGVVPAMIFPGTYSGMSEAVTLSRDTTHLLKGEQDD